MCPIDERKYRKVVSGAIHWEQSAFLSLSLIFKLLFLSLPLRTKGSDWRPQITAQDNILFIQHITVRLSTEHFSKFYYSYLCYFKQVRKDKTRFFLVSRTFIFHWTNLSIFHSNSAMTTSNRIYHMTKIFIKRPVSNLLKNLQLHMMVLNLLNSNTDSNPVINSYFLKQRAPNSCIVMQNTKMHLCPSVSE